MTGLKDLGVGSHIPSVRDAGIVGRRLRTPARAFVAWSSASKGRRPKSGRERKGIGGYVRASGASAPLPMERTRAARGNGLDICRGQGWELPNCEPLVEGVLAGPCQNQGVQHVNHLGHDSRGLQAQAAHHRQGCQLHIGLAAGPSSGRRPEEVERIHIGDPGQEEKASVGVRPLLLHRCHLQNGRPGSGHNRGGQGYSAQRVGHQRGRRWSWNGSKGWEDGLQHAPPSAHEMSIPEGHARLLMMFGGGQGSQQAPEIGALFGQAQFGRLSAQETPCCQGMLGTAKEVRHQAAWAT
jgi:hypothetical protein